MRAVFQFPASMTSVVDAPHAVAVGGGRHVTPEYRVEVSPRLKLDYDNGHSYYPLHDSRVYRAS